MLPGEQSNYSFQKIIVSVGLALFIVKLLAWYYHTKSVAIYSDALESIVNISSSFLSLYSLYITVPFVDFSCRIRAVSDCKLRRFALEKTLVWNLDNIAKNSQDRI